MEGLRLVVRQPALGLAEVAWRWTFATLFWLLFCLLIFEYLDSLPVTKGDLFLLRSGVPSLVLDTVQRILLSGTPRLVTGAAICLLALWAAWVFAASAGRSATFSVLLDQARVEPASEAPGFPAMNSRLSSQTPSKLLSKAVVLLHFWRAALLLATLAAFLGAAMAAAFVASGHSAHPGLTILLFLVLSCVIVMLWCGLDWLLSLAPIFAIRDGESAFGAMSKALTFVHARFRAVVRISALFGAIHIIIFFVVTSLVSAPLSLVRILPPGIVSLSILLVTLLYFVLIDFLRVARFAAYICMAASKSAIKPTSTGY